MASFNQKLGIYQETYNSDKHSSIDQLSRGNLAQADMLTSTVVKFYGDWSNRFPLYLSTMGQGRKMAVKSTDSLFKVPVLGKPKKSSTIAKTIYTSTDTPGKGKQPFFLYFVDKWFAKGDQLESGQKIKVSVEEEPVQEGDFFKYVCKIVGTNLNAFLSFNEIKDGAKFARIAHPVGIKGSRGTEARSQAPAMMQNQCSFIRESYNWEGNLDNKVMTLNLPKKGGGTTAYWKEWEAFQHELRFSEACENMLWYSEFNRTADGKILDKDVNSGEPIVLGSGVLEQIPNSSTYGVLTEEKIKRVVRDVFYNSNADLIRNITLYTGIGGKEEFHNALFASLKGLNFGFQADQFVSGGKNTNTLEYGAYFGTYKHVDGHTITVRQLPLLDFGARSEAAPKHPITDLPITSYDMYFLDESMIDGKYNVQFVYEEGRERIEKIVGGFNAKDSKFVSSDIDASSIHFGESLGVHIYNPINCFKLTCNLS